MNWLRWISPEIDGSIGSRHFPLGVINPWRILYDFELFMFSDGDAVFFIDDDEHPCPDGSFLIVPPGHRHISHAVSPSGVIVHWAHFRWESRQRRDVRMGALVLPSSFEDDKMVETSFDLPSGILRGEVGGRTVYDLHERAAVARRSGYLRDELIANSLFHQELIELLARDVATRTRRRSERLAERTLERLRTLAARPVRECPNVKDWLEELGVSYFHQARVFKQAYGTSPYEYVNAIRLERAKRCLVVENMLVRETAEALGFDDVSYFVRFFRRETGATPGAYARLRRA